MVYGTLCGLMLDNKYRLEQYLGDSDGSALFATHLPDGKPAVARVVPADSAHAPRLDRSWSLATGLSHPNLIHIYASGDAELDGVPGCYAITERPEDRLSEIVASRPLNIEEAREVLNSVVPCLEYLHRNSVAHGNVAAASIVAIGDAVKLLADALTPSDEPGRPGPFGGAGSQDIASLGLLVVEMLTGSRPVNRSDAEQAIANAGLAQPFHDIALGCIRDERFGRWSLQQVASALDPPAVANTPPQAAVEAAGKPKRITTGLIAALAGALLMVLFVVYRMQLGGTKPAVPERTSASRAAGAPAVFPPPPPPKAAIVEKPSPMPQPRARQQAGADWAVVAAIYKNYDAAETRARSLGPKWRRGELQVYPAKGEGSQYMVVVASSLTRDEAEKVQNQARAAGFPKDTYVTRLR